MLTTIPHLMVIDPASHTAELDSLNHISLWSKLPVTYHLPAIFGFATLKAALPTAAGIMILGSAASVNDRHPWQNELEAMIRPLLDTGLPILGICYGHQFLAYLLGGKVGFVLPDSAKLKGFHGVTFKPNRLWAPGPRTLLRSHCEQVFAAPSSMNVIAASPEVAIDALEHRSLPIWSIQAHPEATPVLCDNFGIARPTNTEIYQGGHALVRTFLDAAATQGTHQKGH